MLAFPLPNCVTALCEEIFAVAFCCVSDQHAQTFPWAVLVGHRWSTNKNISSFKFRSFYWAGVVTEEQYFAAILCAINSFLQVLVNESWGVLVVTQKSSHIIKQFIDIQCLINIWIFLIKKMN